MRHKKDGVLYSKNNTRSHGRNVLVTISGTAGVSVVEFSTLFLLLAAESFLVLQEFLLFLLPHEDLQQFEYVYSPSFCVLHMFCIVIACSVSQCSTITIHGHVI